VQSSPPRKIDRCVLRTNSDHECQWPQDFILQIDGKLRWSTFWKTMWIRVDSDYPVSCCRWFKKCGGSWLPFKKSPSDAWSNNSRPFFPMS
jgi:hypothetical protein